MNTRLLVLAAFSLLAACNKDKEGDDTAAAGDGSDGTTDGTDGTTDGNADGTTDGNADGTDGGTTATGALRLVHLGVFPGDMNTGVDIWVNGAASGVSFSFKQTTPFVELPVGTYDFDIVPAGGTLADSVYSVSGFALGEGEQWSVFAAGYVAPREGDNGFGVSAFAESRDGIPAGSVRVNIVHAAALGVASPVDLWAVDDNCAPVSPLIEGFTFNQMAANIDLPSTAVNVGLDIGQDATVDACFKIPATVTDEVVNVYAVNDDAGRVSLIAHLPDGTSAEILPEPPM